MMNFYDSIWFLLAMVVFFGAQIPIILRTDDSIAFGTSVAACLLLGFIIAGHPILS